MNKINVKSGDQVKLKNVRGANWNRDGFMDKYFDKIVTIGYIRESTFYIRKQSRGDSKVEFDNYRLNWSFTISDIEKKIKQKLKLYTYD